MAGNEIWDVIIIGAGLSGLTCAVRLHEAGKKVLVLEAAARVGGRVKSAYQNGRYSGDLGPSWVWPPYQAGVQKFLEKLDLNTEAQFEGGLSVLDLDRGQPVRHQHLPGQHGMTKIAGGPQAIINALMEQLPEECIALNQKAIEINKTSSGLCVHSADGSFVGEQVVVAIPMRLAAETLKLPSECQPLLSDMQNVPTWMAAQCKVVINYENPFWRDRKLSGRVVSHVGPMIEVHDNSSEATGCHALFGFVGVPFEQRVQHRDGLETAIVDQLVRCFGEDAKAYNDITIQDWGEEANVCSKLDQRDASGHPGLAPATLRRVQLDNRLHFAVAEVSTQSPGLIDGALSVGDEVANRILH